MKKFLFIYSILFSLASFGQSPAEDYVITTPKKISPLVNSTAEEDFPILSHSGDKLYFTRSFHEKNIGGKYAGQDIWMSEKVGDSSWSSPTNIFPSEGAEHLNDEYNNVVVGVSFSGDTLYLLNHYHHHKREWKHHHHHKKTEPGLSFTYLMPDGVWSTPKDINTPNLHFDGHHYGLSVNHTGNVVLISEADTETTLGKEDLYAAIKGKNGIFSSPIHLGNVINTEYIEFSPFLSQDERHLYFASNRPGGHGGIDIYVSTRLDSTWKNWSEPINMGPKVNTSGFDAYFSISDDKHVLFARNLDTLTADLYIADVIEKRSPAFDEDSKTTSLSNLIDPNSYLNLEHLVNIDTILQVKDILDVNNKVNKDINIDSLVYESALDFVDDLHKKQGFNVVDLRKTEVRDKTKAEIAEEHIIPRAITIQFDINIHTLDPEDRKVLERVVYLAKNDKDLIITLTGHTCSIGNEGYNKDLSKQRALSAKQFLLSKNVPRKSIAIKWQGELKPIAPNDTDEGRTKNRRVEISFSRK